VRASGEEGQSRRERRHVSGAYLDIVFGVTIFELRKKWKGVGDAG